MNKMKKILFSIGFFLILILLNNKSNATTISVTPSDPKVGDEITVTVTVPNVHTSSVTANVTGVVSGKIKVVGGDLSGEAKSYSNSARFKCEKEGNIDIEITSDSSAVLAGQYVDVSGKKSITVKAKDNASSGSNNTGAAGGNTTAQKSTEAKLSNFGIKPNDFSGFKKNTYNYTHEVPNNVSEVTVYATPVSGATVTSGTGKVALKEGSNTIEVVVKAEAGNTQKYTLTIKRRTAAEEAALSGEASDATLKSLGIKPEEYDFSGFQKDKTEYSVEVPEEVEEIEVYAEATNPKAQINGTGKVQLKNGKNKIIVQVTAEDGTTRTYTIEVTRGGEEATATNDADSGFGLSSLEINGLILTPSFKTGTYEYTIELIEDLSELDIEAIATDEDATIEIIGNENLQLGENTITILVRNEETDETATYQIIVNKNLSAEEEMSWLKPSTWGREEIIKVAIIAVLIILIIIAIILKVKIAKEKKDGEDFDLPGGDELDKALAEHQELEETAEFEKIEMPEERNKTEEMTEIGNAETSEGVDQIEENEISKGVSDLDGTNYIEDIARSKNYKLDYQDDNFNNSGSRKKGKHF